MAVWEGVPEMIDAPVDILRWLHGDARDLTLGGLFKETCERLVDKGVPIRRASMIVHELHPEYLARTFEWRRTGVELRRFYRTNTPAESAAYEKSPVRMIFDGSPMIRHRIAPDDKALEFPILDDLQEEGITDYAIFPVPFRCGDRQALSIATDSNAGFTNENLGLVNSVLTAASLQFEVLVLDQMVHTMLDTYVGPSAGKQVLSGEIARGTGKRISAVLWYADLRQFTQLSEHLRSEALISLLNDYFECIVGPVEEGGGEVLKFIGDAVLAVFPLPKRAVAADVVCEVALAAAENAVENVLSLSASRQAAGDPPIDFGVALHVGDVVFGNVGSEHRLDFTVIGRDVNLVSRLQDLSARLTQTLILSDEFVSHSRREFVDLGSHALKGITTEQRAYTLKPSMDTVIGHQ